MLLFAHRRYLAIQLGKARTPKLSTFKYIVLSFFLCPKHFSFSARCDVKLRWSVMSGFKGARQQQASNIQISPRQHRVGTRARLGKDAQNSNQLWVLQRDERPARLGRFLTGGQWCTYFASAFVCSAFRLHTRGWHKWWPLVVWAHFSTESIQIKCYHECWVILSSYVPYVSRFNVLK